MVLSAHRPTIDLDAAKAALEKSIGGRAKVSVLHDTLVVDVDRTNLVEVARIVRDDPAIRPRDAVMARAGESSLVYDATCAATMG